jgi:predicted dehydrogenase
MGCGAVSRLLYAPAMETLERAGEINVRSLFDPDPRAAAELHSRFPSATVAADEEGFARGLDLAVVASPARFHAAQSMRLLRRGVAVLCEKPMATSSAEAEAMVQAADSAGALLAVGMVRRYLPAAAVIRRVLTGDLLGRPASFSCCEGGEFRWPTRSPSYFDPRGGGVLMDIGVHVLDLLVWWLGAPVALLYEDDAMGGVEANCRLSMRFRAGWSGEVRLSRDVRQPNRYLFTGEKAWLSWFVREPARIQFGLHEADHGLDAQLREVTASRQGPRLERAVGEFEEAFLLQLRDVVTAVREREQPAVPGREAQESLRLIEQCYAERNLLPMPWLGEDELATARSYGRRTR